MIEFVVTLWSAINRKVPRTSNSLLSHQGLSLSLRGSEGSEPGPGSCVKGWGVSLTPAMGLEAPFQETRLMAGWRILATTCALLLRGYNVQNKGCFGARVLEAWPRTFITPRPEQCVVFSNEPRGFRMWDIFAEWHPIGVPDDVRPAALWRKGTWTSRSGLPLASMRQCLESVRPLEGKQKHFLSKSDTSSAVNRYTSKNHLSLSSLIHLLSNQVIASSGSPRQEG